MFLLFGVSFFGPLLFPVLIALVTFVFYKRISERQREDEQIRLLRLRRQNETVAGGSTKKIFTRKRREIDCKSPQTPSVYFKEVTVFYATATGKSKVSYFLRLVPHTCWIGYGKLHRVFDHLVKTDNVLL